MVYNNVNNLVQTCRASAAVESVKDASDQIQFVTRQIRYEHVIGPGTL